MRVNSKIIEIIEKQTCSYFSVGKIAEKPVYRSGHCILSAELTKTHSFPLFFFWRFCPLGSYLINYHNASNKRSSRLNTQGVSVSI